MTFPTLGDLCVFSGITYRLRKGAGKILLLFKQYDLLALFKQYKFGRWKGQGKVEG